MFEKTITDMYYKPKKTEIGLIEVGNSLINIQDINYIQFCPEEKLIRFGFKSGMEHYMHFRTSIQYDCAKNELMRNLKKLQVK